jgi:hypothetical protein
MNVTLADVLDHGRANNINDHTATKFFHHFSSVGWVDAQGRAIVSWKSKLAGWSLEDSLRSARKSPVAQPAKQRIESRTEQLRKMYEQGSRFYTHIIEEMIRYGIASAADFDNEGYKL